MTTEVKNSEIEESAKILVVGVGNLYRRDDGVGILTARRVQREQIPGVQVREMSGEGTSLMEAFDGFETVFLVDAVSSGYPPGSIFRLDPTQGRVPKKFFNCSTHAFSVAEAVEMARVLGNLPQKMTLFGIEGGNFGEGTEVSWEVFRSATKVAHTILREIRELLGIPPHKGTNQRAGSLKRNRSLPPCIRGTVEPTIKETRPVRGSE